jgi:hypothetical protein
MTKKHNNVHLDFVKRFFFVLLSGTGYCYRAVSYKMSHAIATIFRCIVLPILDSTHSQFIHQHSVLWLQQTSSSEVGRN